MFLLVASVASPIRLVRADLDYISYDYGYAARDNTTPALVSISPQNGAYGVPPDTLLSVTFSEAIVAGGGRIVLSTPSDVRRIAALDPQVSRDTSTNRTLLLHLTEQLRSATTYSVAVSPGFAKDLAGNNFHGTHLQFRTSGERTAFAAFSPYVQAPDSPVIFAFRTAAHCLYGSAVDEYRLSIWPSEQHVFHVPPAGPDGMDERCARITEVSAGFPSIGACWVLDGRFQVSLRGALLATTEYSLVARWPVVAGAAGPAEVLWHLQISRAYGGISVELQRLVPWRHRFGDYLYNQVDDSRGALEELDMIPMPGHRLYDWLGSSTTKEFQVVLRFNDPGLLPGSRILFVASPFLSWSTNPAHPSNLSTLQSLESLDPVHLSDYERRASPCLHFFPGDLPFTTQCRNLEFGLGGQSYGLELRLPARGIGASALRSVVRTFALSLPGVLQPLALVTHWHAISVQAASSPGSLLTHGTRRESTHAMVLNTSAGMSLNVLSSDHPYPVPVGTRINRVELEFSTGTFVLGRTEVAIELWEPSLARVEMCEEVAGSPRLVAQPPTVTDEPVSKIRWALQPPAAGAGAENYVAYPHLPYRAVCWIYNGPRSAPYSQWRLQVTSENAAGERFVSSRTFTSHTYFVATMLAGAQVMPTMPVLGRWQAIFVRADTPVDDGITLRHWTSASHHLRLSAPTGFGLPQGPCLGFKPLTSSAMPPAPLSRCSTTVGAQALDVTIDVREPGFEPGRAYAFRVVVMNPRHWEEVQSRAVARVPVPRANQWTLSLLQDDGLPLAMLEDVPLAYSIETAALRPEDKPGAHDTSFRIFQRPIVVHSMAAEEPYLGQSTRVTFSFSLATPLRSSDQLQITAPSSFAWVQQRRLEHNPETLGSMRPFPGREPRVMEVAWIIQIGVNGGADASVPYGVVLNVTNAVAWSALDQDLNFWLLETFYDFGGILDKRGRRDAAVQQGYPLRGMLLHCAVVPTSRLKGEEAWFSLTFQLNEPLFYHSWTQLDGPSELHLRVPKGFHFAAMPIDGNCSVMVHAEAFLDSPPLPEAQFPHKYVPLADLGGFRCRLDSERLDLARTLILEAVQEANFGLLPHLLYAFRVRAVTPAYDRIFDVRWSLSTVDFHGRVHEHCSVDSLPGLEPALAALEWSPVQEGTGTADAGASSPLPNQRFAVRLAISEASPLVAPPGSKQIAVRAPPGFVFLRDCVASVRPPLEEEAWTLLSCSGRGAEAILHVSMGSDGTQAFTIYARAPAQLMDGQPLVWSIYSLVNRSGYQTTGLIGPVVRSMRQATLQPFGVPFFRASPDTQRAVLAVAPSVAVPLSSLLEVTAPRHMSFTFDADSPCAALYEDPELLTLSAMDLAMPGVTGPCNGFSASTGAGCQWPQVTSCTVSHWGTRLTIGVELDVEPGEVYCFEVRVVGPVSQVAPSLPVSATLRPGNDADVVDLAPIVLDDGGRGWGVAPFVQRSAHLSLCYRSRIPSPEPRELTVRFVPSSLGVRKPGMSLVGQVCLNGAALATSAQSACRILEPRPVEQALSDRSSCMLLSSDSCSGVCVALQGDLWMAFRLVGISLSVQMPPGVVPRVDLQILDATGSIVQGDSASLQLPVLSRLGGVRLSAPRTASTAVAFPVALTIDWPAMGAAFLEELVEAEEEVPAVLDIATPPGLRLSLSCRPVACRHVVPDALTPRPVLRLFLLQLAPLSRWQRRLQRWQRRLRPGAGVPATALRCGPGAVAGRVALRCTAVRSQRLLLARRTLDASSLPTEVHLTAEAMYPLTPSSPENAWELALRSPALRVLGAEAFPGFGVSEHMDLRMAASSQRAGDVFSLFIVEFRLQVPLYAGDVIVLVPPSPGVACRPELAEPTELVGSSAVLLPNEFPGSCQVELRRHLRAEVQYSFNMPLTNPILTPVPNVWFVQTFSKASSRRRASAGSTQWSAHSVAEGLGFEVVGEFEFLRVVAKSSAPRVFTPVAVHFKLRTPFPELPTTDEQPWSQEPAVRLRLAVLTGNGTAQVSAFEPGDCLLDVLQTPVLTEPVPDAETILPRDCLVTHGGAAVEFFFNRLLQARYAYVVWTWMHNPTSEAMSDPAWAYAASSVVRGERAVHRSSVRPAPLLGLQASVEVGSYTAGTTHRAVVSVLGGRLILGQRGAIEVTLPLGFEGSCSREHFRPRPALPSTARCRGHEAADGRGGRVIVYWRSLFHTGGLRPPYEFSFQLTNGNSSFGAGLGGAWHIRIFEGESLEFFVDGTQPRGLQPFELCPALDMNVRREGPRVMSIVFRASRSLPEGFENLVRVELRSSSRAAAELRCPETSIWQRRPVSLGSVQGLPRYTVCVSEPSERSAPVYEESARQHRSAVMFLLPFSIFRAAEPYGLEVSLERIAKHAEADLSPSEARAELINLYLESNGLRQECASAPLGTVQADDGGGSDDTSSADGGTVNG